MPALAFHKEQTSLYTTNICLYFIFSNFSQRKSTLGLTNKFCSFFCRGTNNYYICIRFVTGCSAVRLARQLRELEVAGSNPVSPTNSNENLCFGKGFFVSAPADIRRPSSRHEGVGGLFFSTPHRGGNQRRSKRTNTGQEQEAEK